MNSEVFKAVNGITKHIFHFTEAFTETFTFGVDSFEHCGNKEKERILWQKFPKKLWKYFKGIKPNHCRLTFNSKDRRVLESISPPFSSAACRGSALCVWAAGVSPPQDLGWSHIDAPWASGIEQLSDHSISGSSSILICVRDTNLSAWECTHQTKKESLKMEEKV